MRHDGSEAADKDWPRIAAIFLRAPAKPTSFETEAFVHKVMSRLEEPSPSWNWSRWLVPAMSFALAISALLIARPDPGLTPPEDVVLLAGSSGLTPQAEPPSTDDLAALDMERQ